MIYRANCKINIGLNIINKRDDGFHNLSSIMYPVKGLADLVEVVHSDTLRFTSSGLTIDCAPENNLCLKAYNLIKEEYKEIPPLHIHLHKIVPFGAGLGGGSSDATFTLKAIDELLSLGISKEKMIELASRLGSDTPFFVDNCAQLCSSRGEVMEHIDIDLSDYYITVIKPDFSISTAAAFAGVIPHKAEFSLKELPSHDISTWKEILINDFEASLCPRYGYIEEIKEQLYKAGATYASLSGSGSAIFAISKEELDKDVFAPELFFHSSRG